MGLTDGASLGHYEILSTAGAGGMGEVYRAIDKRLRREVAIKILPVEFARDPERIARFEREARVLASLNHPGIAAIHDFDASSAPPYLALEFVPGETIADLIARGPVEPAEAVKLAIQIADALGCAHDKGIIHRDLKPANIKVTPDGSVKVLDFGLAKAFTDDAPTAASPISDSPTVTMAATNAGVILGTAGYMSPEQVRGKAVDKRADIWAFGCVLFEMLAGRRTFDGDTVPDVLSGVLRADIDWSMLPPSTPPLLRRVLRRCLERDLTRRLPDVRAAKLDLEESLSEPGATAVVKRGWSRFVWPAMAAMSLTAAVVLASIHFRERPAKQDTLQLDIALPGKMTFRSGLNISPDGRTMAFMAAEESRPYLLWARPLHDSRMTPLAGTESAGLFFWSADSRSIAFWSDGKLKKVALAGGPAVTICDTPQVLGGSWRSDGVMVFGTFDRGMFAVRESGGTPTQLTRPESGSYQAFPVFLPDGKHLIYVAAGTPRANQLMVARFANDALSDVKPLLEIETSVHFVPGRIPDVGYLLHVRDGVLLAQPFDTNRLAIHGQALPVAENVGSFLTRPFFTAAKGTIVYWSSTGQPPSNLNVFQRDGSSELMPIQARPYTSLDVSSDGLMIAVDGQVAPKSGHDIAVLDAQRGVLTRLTFDAALDTNPVWSPSGDSVAFASNRDGRLDIYRKAASGAGPQQLLLKTERDKRPMSWSGSGLMYTELSPENGSDLWVLPMNGGVPVPGAKPVPYLNGPSNESQGQFSPDGKWVAYVSDDSGSPQVYVQSYPPTGGKWQISTNGGAQPRWSRNSRELFFVDLNRFLHSVKVTTSPAFQPAAPTRLFDTRMMGGASTLLFRYALAANDRFIVLAGDPGAGAGPAKVIVNWEP